MPHLWRCGVYLAQKLQRCGIDVYLYNGFIHSKALVCEYVLSIGSCNFDNRSFNLNFEATALLYDSNNIKLYKQTFNNDLKNSSPLKKIKHSKINSFYAKVIYLIFGKIF